MADAEKTMSILEWKKRLRKITFGDRQETKKTDRVSNIMIAFLVGFLFGIIVAGILIPYLRALF